MYLFQLHRENIIGMYKNAADYWNTPKKSIFLSVLRFHLVENFSCVFQEWLPVSVSQAVVGTREFRLAEETGFIESETAKFRGAKSSS